MRSCLLHAANGRSSTKLSRSEIIANIRAEKKHEELFERVRERFAPPIRRVARVTRKPSISGFHVVGLGNVSGITLNELKVRLGVAGYTDARMGAVRFNLFKNC